MNLGIGQDILNIRAANILVKNTHRKKVVVELTDYIQRSMENLLNGYHPASLHPIMIYFQRLIKIKNNKYYKGR